MIKLIVISNFDSATAALFPLPDKISTMHVVKDVDTEISSKTAKTESETISTTETQGDGANKVGSTYCFERSSVIIGGQNSPSADLVLTEDLLDKHVQIITQQIDKKKQYYIVNLAHDPFVTLNNLSFGKRALHHKDLIQIKNITLRFEAEDAFQTEPKTVKKSEFTQNVIKANKEFTSTDVDELMQQVEALAAINTKPLNATEPLIPFDNSIKMPQELVSKNTPVPSQQSFPNDMQKDFFDEDVESSFVREKVIVPPFNPKVKNFWSGRFKLFGLTLGMLAVLIIGIFLWINDESGEAELRAARSIADVAMALTYSEIKNIHPQNQNWADHEFINNTLTSVLAPNYRSLATFNKHGQFTSCPYILRIYTSSNLSQFLVIAQPAPSLLQWLLPKSTIVIDSQAMEIRKINDLKSLNRLLVNSNMTEGTHTEEISSLLKQGELIPLIALDDQKENYGFSCPKALALIRPGAENTVYNAPRYYLLGQNLISKARDLVEKTSSNHDVTMFQHELTELADFPNLVLYSFEGLNYALESQKALALLAPKEKFLMAYLQLNIKGQIIGTHLLLDDTPTDISQNEFHPENLMETSIFHPSPEILTPVAQEHGIDQRDPFFLRLSNLNVTRQKTLKPISDEMIALLIKQTQAGQLNFSTEFLKLEAQYMKLNEEQHHHMMQEIGLISTDANYLPASHFLQLVKAANLDSFLQDYLNLINHQLPDSHLTKEDIERSLKQIESSTSWQELENHSHQIAKILDFKHIPNEENLVAYQNAARTHVIQKLNLFLLSPNGDALPAEAFKPEYRQTLMNILEYAWIIDPDTYNFYLAEFELRAAPLRTLKRQ